MSEDRYGCPLSTTKPEIIQSANSFSIELLHAGKKLNQILEEAEKYPKEVILQIYAAIFTLYEQTPEAAKKASTYLDKASHLLDQANEREKSLYAIAWHWLQQLLSEALKSVERHCFKWPKDLTVIKIAEFLFYCKGLKFESNRFLRLTSHCYHWHKEDPSFLAMHAFSLELSGKYQESLQIAQNALKHDEENPWIYYTLAHIFMNRGNIQEGIQLLEQQMSKWQGCHLIFKSRLLWLLALFYIENLDTSKIQMISNEALWFNQERLLSVKLDAIALLWRLELEGDDQSPLWHKIAETIQVASHFEDIPYSSILFCYALKKGNRAETLKEALAKIEDFIHEQTKEDHFIWKTIALPFIAGAFAYAERDYPKVLQYITPIIEQVSCVGGSDVQIDLFYRLYLRSLIGSNHYIEAEAFIHKRTQGRNLTQLEHKWLTECQSKV